MIDTSTTIIIDGIPTEPTPAALARGGELLGLEANGPEGNPSARAWMRAGIAASDLLRTTERTGRISADLLVALIAGNCDPEHDYDTPQRGTLIGEHVSVEHEWARGVASAAGADAHTAEEAIERAAKALAVAYNLDGDCMQRVVCRALAIWNDAQGLVEESEVE